MYSKARVALNKCMELMINVMQSLYAFTNPMNDDGIDALIISIMIALINQS